MDWHHVENQLHLLSPSAQKYIKELQESAENDKRNEEIKARRRKAMQRFQDNFINNNHITLEDCLEELVNCVHDIYEGAVHSRIYEVKHLSEVKSILDNETLAEVTIPFVLQRQYDSRNNPRIGIRDGDYLPIIEGRVTGDAFLRKTIVVSIEEGFCGECHPDAIYSSSYDAGLFEPRIQNRAAVPLKTQYSNTIEYIFIIDREDGKPIDLPVIENLRSLTRDAQSMIYEKKWKTIIDQNIREDENRRTILHNLRSPLTSIGTSAKKVHLEIAKPEEIRDFERVAIYTEILAETIPRVLVGLNEFLKGRFAYNPEPVNIDSLLAGIPRYCSHLAESGVNYLNNIHIHLDLQSDAIVYVDPGAIMTHAICNMIKNSGEQCKNGCDIYIATESCGDKLLLTIEDTAGGIDPTRYDLIMHPMERYSTKGKNRGFGVRSIYEILDKPEEGRVFHVINRYPKGLTYICELPLISSDIGIYELKI
jgi:signal transduction histidine kinase